jgi:hypothetical protein
VPVVAVNVSNAVFEELRGLVEKGLYVSPEQFLEIAAFNQLALERGATPAQVMAGGHRGPDPKLPERANGAGRSATRSESRRGNAVRPVARKPAKITAADVALVHSRLSVDKIADPPPPRDAAPRPADERLYGLVNRLFPLKLACRWLAVTNSGRKKWERYAAIAEMLADDAAVIGSALEQADHKAQRKRDELLSTGLPRKGNLASYSRFLSQYLARTTRAAEIYPGAICQYALAEFDDDRIALTDRGIALARLENPILDGDPSAATSMLTTIECSFLSSQITAYVPAEHADFAAVIAALQGGHVTPDDLLNAVKSSLPATWSETMVRSHVSGVVARLADISGVKRNWSGRNVRYEAADLGTAFLNATRISS